MRPDRIVQHLDDRASRRVLRARIAKIRPPLHAVGIAGVGAALAVHGDQPDIGLGVAVDHQIHRLARRAAGDEMAQRLEVQRPALDTQAVGQAVSGDETSLRVRRQELGERVRPLRPARDDGRRRGAGNLVGRRHARALAVDEERRAAATLSFMAQQAVIGRDRGVGGEAANGAAADFLGRRQAGIDGIARVRPEGSDADGHGPSLAGRSGDPQD